MPRNHSSTKEIARLFHKQNDLKEEDQEKARAESLEYESENVE